MTDKNTANNHNDTHKIRTRRKEDYTMTIEEKITLIAETLDTDQDNIKPDAELKSIEEWDSMGVISTIAMLDRKFGKILSAEQIEELKTVQDIFNLMI